MPLTLHPVLAQAEPVHYLPAATTVMAAAFLSVLVRRAGLRKWPPHLAWWAAGVFFYGLGTALEASVTIFGNSVALNKAWYIAGALLGGYPLAQGTVYLLMKRRVAHALTAATVPLIVVGAVLVALSPVHHEALLPHKPGGEIIAWTWVRWSTPIINIYAVVFLVGGAIYSAVKYALSGSNGARAIGNAMIAAGATMPGIGGAMTKAGMVEALYLGEFVGLALIWAGFTACVRKPTPQTPASSTRAFSAANQQLQEEATP